MNTLADDPPRKEEGTHGHPKGRQKAEHTIGEIPEDVWPMIQTMLDEHYPIKPIEHRRVDLCRC
jgi:hypothetical protein